MANLLLEVDEKSQTSAKTKAPEMKNRKSVIIIIISSTGVLK